MRHSKKYNNKNNRKKRLFKKLTLYITTILVVIAFTNFFNTVDIAAESALIIDSQTNKIIYNKKSTSKMYPASTTKILTAITALDYLDLDEIVYVDNEIYLTPLGSSTAGLCKGEKLSVRDLIYALMLPSGNDAAQVLAVYTGKKLSKQKIRYKVARDKFLELMNKKAQEIGAVNSNFTTVDGFHDTNHYSTAKDLALITQEALKNNFLGKVAKTITYQVGKHNDWRNTNKLIQQDSEWFTESVTGFKTGFTSHAGYCLVATAIHNNKSYILVLLNGPKDDIYADAQKLINKHLS